MARPGGEATEDLITEKATSSRDSCRHDESLMSMRTRVCYTTNDLVFFQVQQHIWPSASCLVPAEMLSSVEYWLLQRGIGFHDSCGTGLNGDTELVLLTYMSLITPKLPPRERIWRCQWQAGRA